MEPQTAMPVDPLGQQDAEHLRLLSIFHYVVAAFAGLFSLLPLIHLAMGIAILRGAFDSGHGQPPPTFFGWMLIGMATVFILLGLSYTVCLVLTGRWLAARTHYAFCFVIGCLSTPLFPFGTAIGVFTIIVLSRESVKRAFPSTFGVGAGQGTPQRAS
jgi:hypothetical protein